MDDYARGYNPELFNREAYMSSGRPAGLSDTKVRALAAAAYELLNRQEMSSDERATFVVMELLKLKITRTLSIEEITADTVKNWQKEMICRSNPEASDVYEKCLAIAEEGIETGICLEALKAEIRNILKQLEDGYGSGELD